MKTEMPTTGQENKIENSDSELLSSVIEIPESRGQFIAHRDKIKELVETPLVKAAEELYDKNIRTTESTANRQNVKYGKSIGIVIDFDSLSEENKEVAKKLCRVANHPDGYTSAGISIPVNEASTIKEIEDNMHSIVSQFQIQPLLWAQPQDEDGIRKIFCLKSSDAFNPEEFSDFYYYDLGSKLFYPSEEIFEKMKKANQ